MPPRAALAVLACAAALGAAGSAPAAPAPARFQAGAAKGSIAPLPGVPVYAGGFGFSPPISELDDPVEVRAFYVDNGRKALAMATVDVQGFFAAYQEGPRYGITAIREEAARRITALTGIATTKTDVVVQATHTHAGATLEGIWGPVPRAYLDLVRERTIQAIVDAAASRRAAQLRMGTYDAPWLNNVDVVQYDSYPGWTQDGQVSVLRATAPDGGSIGTFASVPAHPDIVEGSAIRRLSADYLGFARTALDERLGGVNVVGPATLGRNETPIQVGGVDASRWFAGVVTSVIGRAIANATPLTTDTLASAETFTRVPGTNAALLALNAAWKLPDEQKMQLADAQRQLTEPVQGDDATSMYPIDRSMDPPYLTGSAIGADLTALRVGDNVFLSLPGEPFPEVRNTIAQLTTGARRIVALSKAQDDWGYFYPSWVTPFTTTYASDHLTFSIAPEAGDLAIKAQADNLSALGFATERLAVSTPLLGNRYEQAFRPAVQAMAAPTWGDAGADGTLPVAFTAVFSAAYAGGPGLDGPIRVDFGDGTTAQVPSDKRARFVHQFAPGTYPVRLVARDGNGQEATWEVVVRVFRRLVADVAAEPAGAGTWRLRALTSGGDGEILRRDWRFADGDTASGATVTHTFAAGRPRAELVVADGTTTTATAEWSPGA